jgi:hypothetical protein
MIRLAHNLALPVEVVTQSVAILAKKRAGKSYTARRFAEQIHHAAQQIVIVDPKGDWWGIRSSADGKRPGLPVVILGGEHGDLPLEVGAGEVVARLVVEERASVLLDLSLLRKREVAVFMTAFLENLYRMKAREQYRTPVMLVVDEADAIAPQKPYPDEARMLGAAEDIVRRGGQRGIGCMLITQRSAVLNKNVLTQTQLLVALRTIAPQDLKALDEWIDVHGTREQRAHLMESLPSLPIGEAWFWSPGWPTNDGIFGRHKVLAIETFDSGKTPAPGERRVEPKNLADVDLDTLKRQMADTVERAKADDPKALRKRIAELEAAARATPATKEKRVEVPALKDAQLAALERVVGRIEETTSSLAEIARQTQELGREVMAAARNARGAPPPRPPLIVPPPRTAQTECAGGPLPRGEEATLAALIQYPNGLRREQLTVITGYKRSSRDAYVQRLREKGFVETTSDRVVATPDGQQALPNARPLPTGVALQEYHLARLPEGERAVLQQVIASYPLALERETIDQATGYKRSSRDAYLQRLRSKELVVTDGGGVRASDTLFE